jgi:hypothetical protein
MGLSNEALMVGHSIPLPIQHPLTYKGAWELSGNSLPDPVIEI